MKRCSSGRHYWLDPISAARCCSPEWARELRFGLSDLQPGDAPDGVTVLRAGYLYVWHRKDRKDDDENR
jgi:hypothetical protein